MAKHIVGDDILPEHPVPLLLCAVTDLITFETDGDRRFEEKMYIEYDGTSYYAHIKVPILIDPFIDNDFNRSNGVSFSKTSVSKTINALRTITRGHLGYFYEYLERKLPEGMKEDLYSPYYWNEYQITYPPSQISFYREILRVIKYIRKFDPEPDSWKDRCSEMLVNLEKHLVFREEDA